MSVAYYRGEAGIIKITPQGEASHVVSGVNLVGLGSGFAWDICWS